MAETARNFDNNENHSTKEELSALENRETGTVEILEIHRIKGGLRQQIDDAGSIFTKKDKEDFQKEIEETAKKVDPEALKAISGKINERRKDIEKITGEYRQTMDQSKKAFTQDSGKNIDTIAEYLEDFKKLSYDEKIKRKDTLGEDINDRMRVYNELVKLVPENEVQKMRRHERQNMLDELNKNLKPHQQAAEDFMAFPENIRTMKRGEFFKLKLDQKETVLTEMKKELRKTVDTEISKARQEQIFSPEEIKEQEDHFKNARITGPYGVLKSFEMFKDQADLARTKKREFDGLIEELPKEDPLELKREYTVKFLNASYNSRTMMCAELKAKIEIMDKQLDRQYFDMLDKYQGQQVISRETQKEFMEWFLLQPLKDKPKNINLLDGDADQRQGVAILSAETKQVARGVGGWMGKYMKTLLDFRALPPEIQIKHANDFYNKRPSDRKGFIDKIMQDEKMAAIINKQRQTPKPEDKQKQQTKTAPDQLKTIDNKDALSDKTDEELLTVIKEGENARAVLEARQLYTTLAELGEAANTNALINENKKDAAKRSSGMTAEESRLQEELSAFTQQNNRAEKVLRRNKSGKLMAAEVIKVDAKKIGEKSQEEQIKLKRKATTIQRGGENEKKTTSEIEFINEGNTVTNQTGLEQTRKKSEDIDSMIADRAKQGLEQKGDKLTFKDRERLINLSAKRDKKVKMEMDTAA
jgi:hypothetical protein